jgi:4'-phosphopantetheinyl transferase
VPLQFNVSHSDDWIAIAIARTATVGIDIERIRMPFRATELAGRFFADAEKRALAALPEVLRLQGFFNGWTRKEAYVKALGAGVQLGLDTFAVSLAPNAPVRFLSGVDAKWRLLSFEIGPGMSGALVHDLPKCDVSTYDADDYFKSA